VRKYAIAGLLVWLPAAITIWVLLWLIGLMDGIFVWILTVFQAVLPSGLDNALSQLRQVPGLGVVVTLGAMLLTGMFVTNIFGQWWVRQWDRILTRIPIVKSIYSSVKQVSDTLFASNGNAFREAVLVPYPHADSWTIAFVTGRPGGEVAQHLPSEHLSLYVPTTPNPTSGFFLIMPRASVRSLGMSVDEALKYIISMGVVAPPAVARRVDSAPGAGPLGGPPASGGGEPGSGPALRNGANPHPARPEEADPNRVG
jgi:uncharacterized membrane protein